MIANCDIVTDLFFRVKMSHEQLTSVGKYRIMCGK